MKSREIWVVLNSTSTRDVRRELGRTGVMEAVLGGADSPEENTSVPQYQDSFSVQHILNVSMEQEQGLSPPRGLLLGLNSQGELWLPGEPRSPRPGVRG